MFIIARALFFDDKLVASSQQAAWRALRDKERTSAEQALWLCQYGFALASCGKVCPLPSLLKSVKIDCAQLSKCKWFHNICLLFLSSFQQQTGRAHLKNCVGWSCPNLSPMELQIFQQLLGGNNLLRNLAHLIKLLGPAQLSRQPTDAGVTFPLQENLTQNDRWHLQFEARDSKSPKWTYTWNVLWINAPWNHSHNLHLRLPILDHNWPLSWAFCHWAGTWEIEPAGEDWSFAASPDWWPESRSQASPALATRQMAAPSGLKALMGTWCAKPHFTKQKTHVGK